jgi:hypothetical protein
MGKQTKLVEPRAQTLRVPPRICGNTRSPDPDSLVLPLSGLFLDPVHAPKY